MGASLEGCDQIKTDLSDQPDEVGWVVKQVDDVGDAEKQPAQVSEPCDVTRRRWMVVLFV
jgi:hypothetical protein